MNRPSPAPRFASRAAILASGLITLFLLAPAVASAAEPVPVTGKAVFTLGAGKAGKALTGQGGAVAGIAPATVKRLSGKRFRVTLPPVSIRLSPGQVALGGGIAFRRGARTVPIRDGRVAVAGKSTVVTAKVGGRRITVFRSGKKLEVGRALRNLKWHAVAGLNNAPLALTPAAARVLKKRLGLKRLPAGTVGSLSLDADRLDEPVIPPPVDIGDPYFAQCDMIATSIGSPPLPEAAPVPAVAGSDVTTGSPAFTWGFKKSFGTAYLAMFHGKMVNLNGAGRSGVDPWDPFTFPVTGGRYDAATGRAVINTSGTGLFCNKEHGFRVALSNVTLVIDGTNSRLVADVDFNRWGAWFQTRRIDLATLDASGITPVISGGGTEITWTGIPTKLTDEGAEPFCSKGGPPGTPNICIYTGPSGPAGATTIDPVTVTVEVSPPIE